MSAHISQVVGVICNISTCKESPCVQAIRCMRASDSSRDYLVAIRRTALEEFYRRLADPRRATTPEEPEEYWLEQAAYAAIESAITQISRRAPFAKDALQLVPGWTDPPVFGEESE